MLIDSHIHVGHYREGIFYPPDKVATFLSRRGITHGIVMTAGGDGAVGHRVIADCLECRQIKWFPLLWTIPSLVNSEKKLKKEFSLLPYRGFKIHPANDDWRDSDLLRILAIADEMALPILAHTGVDACCNPLRWLKLLANHRYPVVLAHGRPVEHTAVILSEHPCAYADTAFMPTDDLRSLVQLGYGDRLLFGTDYPINTYFYKSSPLRWYKTKLQADKSVLPAQYQKNYFFLTGLKIFANHFLSTSCE